MTVVEFVRRGNQVVPTQMKYDYKVKVNESLYRVSGKVLGESAQKTIKTESYYVQRDLTTDSKYRYSGNGGRSWVTADSDAIDKWATEDAAIKDGEKSFKSDYVYGVDWDVVEL